MAPSLSHNQRRRQGLRQRQRHAGEAERSDHTSLIGEWLCRSLTISPIRQTNPNVTPALIACSQDAEDKANNYDDRTKTVPPRDRM